MRHKKPESVYIVSAPFLDLYAKNRDYYAEDPRHQHNCNGCFLFGLCAWHANPENKDNPYPITEPFEIEGYDYGF
jgi:hypothetical protein